MTVRTSVNQVNNFNEADTSVSVARSCVVQYMSTCLSYMRRQSSHRLVVLRVLASAYKLLTANYFKSV